MDNNMLRWLVAIVLLAHGIGHIIGFLESWTNVPAGFTSQPWLLSDGVTFESSLGRLFGLLWLLALFAFLAATVGLLGNLAWWRPLAIAAAVLSLLVIMPWWNTVTAGARWGAVLADLAILAVLLPAWGEQIAQRLGTP